MESVAEATEYTAAGNMDTGAAADLATRIPPNLSEPVPEQNVWNTCLFTGSPSSRLEKARNL